MSSAPALYNSASTFSPFLSMKVTPVRSTTHLRSLRAVPVSVHVVFSSDIHGGTSRPSSVHFCSVTVSTMVIRSINFELFPDARPSRMGASPHAFPHMDFRAASFEVHFVHVRFH